MSAVDPPPAPPSGRTVENVLDGVDPEILGLLSPRRWRETTLGIAFPDDGRVYGLDYSRSNEPGPGFAPAPPLLEAAVRAALAEVAAVSGLVFVDAERPVDATIRVAASPLPPIAWAYPVAEAAAGGDVWFDPASAPLAPLADPDATLPGTFAWHTVLHELGHGLGLKHGHEGEGANQALLPRAVDGMAFTVMTYRSHPEQRGLGAYRNAPDGYAQSLMTLDIAALQHLYGPNYDHAAGDDVYAVSPETGALIVNGVAGPPAAGGRVFRTLWDGGGRDVIDLSAYDRPVRIDLTPGGAGIDLDPGGLAQRAELAPGVHAPAHLFLARLHEGDPRGLIEAAVGGSAADALIGNQADNTLVGGPGGDLLVGGAGANRFEGVLADLDGDRIADFSARDALVATDAAAPFVHAALAPTAAAALTDGLAPALLRDLAGVPAAAAGLDAAASTARLTLAGAGGAAALVVGFAEGPAALALAQAGGEAVLTAPQAGDLRLGDGGDRALFHGPAPRRIEGGAGPDAIRGGDGGAVIVGRGGGDLLMGGAGDDVIVAGPDGAVLEGGGGVDRFVFHAPPTPEGPPVVHFLRDFDPAQDRALVVAADAPAPGFTALPGGVLATLAPGLHAVFEGFGAADAPALAAAVETMDAAMDFRLLAVDPVRDLGPEGGRYVARGAEAVTLIGGPGDAVLVGGAGDDVLIGGGGSNRLAGGPGADRFVFRLADATGFDDDRRDAILDFEPGRDVIALDGFSGPLGFAATPEGLAFDLLPGWRVVLEGLHVAPEAADGLGLFA